MLHVDAEIQVLLGYDAMDFIESRVHFPDLIHSDDHDIVAKLFSLKSQEASKIVNFRCRQANGKIICVQGSFQKYYDKSLGLKLILQLIDAKLLNQYLNDPILLSNFTTMMKSSEDYIYFKDRNHVFTGASQTLVSVTDPLESWADLIGKTDYDVFPEEYADAYYRLEKQVFSGMPVAHEIQKTLDNQGNIGWVDNRKYPIFDNNNEIIGLFGIARDITEVVANQQKVKRLLAKQNAILENDLVGFATVKNRKYTWVNPALSKLFGYSASEFEGMSTRVLYANEQDYQDIGASYAILGSKDVLRHNIEFVCKDGSHIWCDLSGTLLDTEDGVSLWSLVDVTKFKLSEVALKSSEMRFRTLFDSNSDAVMLLDNDGLFNCNAAALKIFGCSTVAEFRTKTPAQLSPLVQSCGTSSLELAKQQVEKAKKQGSFSFEWLHKRLDDGRVFPAEVLLTTMILDKKQVVQGVVRDITERKRVEKERNEALNRLQKISKNVPGMVYQFCLYEDGSSCFPYASPAIQEIFRVTAEEAKESSEKVFAAIHSDDLPYVIESINVSKETFAPWHVEFRVQFPDGTVNWLLGDSLPEKSDQWPMIWHGFVTDITARKDMEQQIHRLAFYDELTKLANRRLLNDRLNLSLASSKRSGRYGALIILDLDNFKSLNDMHGHLVGDLLLIEAANRLSSCVREIDTVARFGGDEFVVMLNALDADKIRATLEATVIAEKILNALATPYFLKVNRDDEVEVMVEHYCSASIGVAMFINHLGSKEDILNWADSAMYQAKDAGRNQVRIYKLTV